MYLKSVEKNELKQIISDNIKLEVTEDEAKEERYNYVWILNEKREIYHE